MPAREAAVTNAADSIVVYHQFMAARVAERSRRGRAPARRDRRLQPRRLRLDVAAARLAPRAGSAGRRRCRPLAAAVTEVEPRRGRPLGPAAGPSCASRPCCVTGSSASGRTSAPPSSRPSPSSRPRCSSTPARTSRCGRPTSSGCAPGRRLAVGRRRLPRRAGEVVGGLAPRHPAPAAAAHTCASTASRCAASRRAGDEVSAVYSDPPPPGITTLPRPRQRPVLGYGVHPRGDRPVSGPTAGSTRPSSSRSSAEGRRRARSPCPSPSCPSKCSAPGRSTTPSPRWPSPSLDGPDALPRTGRDRPARAAPPRQRDGGPLPAVGTGPTRHIDAISAALLGSDDSYLAVQGPPGTGKTYVASHVIARLVLEHGWRVGVTSQGHKAIENVLRAVVAAGVPPSQVGKATRDTVDPRGPPSPRPTTSPSFAGRTRRRAAGTSSAAPPGTSPTPGGCSAVSSTSSSSTRPASSRSPRPWPARSPVTGCSPRRPAAAAAGVPGHPPRPRRRLRARLAHRRRAGAAPELGYFLETTWRMHPASPPPSRACRMPGSCAPRSRSPPCAASRASSPGCTCAWSTTTTTRRGPPRRPRPCSTSSATSSAAPGTTRRSAAPTASRSGPGRSGPADVIVITPYNGQVGQLRRTLDDAGLTDVAVGTVDKFQGQEAPVVDHVDGGVVALRRLARHGLPPRPAPPQRRGLAGPARGLPRALRGAHRLRAAHTRELIALGAFLGLCNSAVTTETIAADLVPAPTRRHRTGTVRGAFPIRLRGRAEPHHEGLAHPGGLMSLPLSLPSPSLCPAPRSSSSPVASPPSLRPAHPVRPRSSRRRPPRRPLARSRRPRDGDEGVTEDDGTDDEGTDDEGAQPAEDDLEGGASRATSGRRHRKAGGVEPERWDRRTTACAPWVHAGAAGRAAESTAFRNLQEVGCDDVVNVDEPAAEEDTATSRREQATPRRRPGPSPPPRARARARARARPRPEAKAKAGGARKAGSGTSTASAGNGKRQGQGRR